jgi:hypothetical protein
VPKFLVIVFLVTISGLSQAQLKAIFIKGDFYNKSLIDFIQEVEQKHHVQFHFVNEIVKDITVTGRFAFNTPLMEALEILLRDKPISFTTNMEGEIILFENQKKVFRVPEKFYKLTGKVNDKTTGNPLPYVTVYVPALSKNTITDEKGNFEIKPVPAGIHLVQLSFIGYRSVVTKITVTEDTFITLHLSENATELKELVITPSTFEISANEAPLTLGKEEILHSPNMGKDIYRTLRALPGIANNDFSAKARIRGGHSDETGVYLDHLLINDPFHLEEVDGSFSIFNTDYVDELTVLTGGFSAKYTDRLSGIVDVKTSDHVEADKYRFSIDLMNASLLAQKKINDKTNVFVTARRGYLDFLLKKMGTTDTDLIDPRFSDIWGKVCYAANDKNQFTFNILTGRDNFHVRDQDDFAAQLNLQNIRTNFNGWVNWKWFPSQSFSSITTLAYQELKKDASFVFPENIDYTNIDRNDTKALVLTQNSYWNLRTNGSFEFGVELKKFDSRYQYDETRYDVYRSTLDNVITDTIDINTAFRGYTASGYLQYNWTIFKGLIFQPGIRASSQSFSPDLKLAPRVAVSYKLSPSFTTRIAYGKYYQPDLYFKLRTALSQEKPYSKNSECTQYTGSLTYSRKRTNIMLNGYIKNYDYLFDDYRFEFFNRLGGVNILDIPFNTTSGYAKGAEIMVRQSYGTNSMISVSYAYSRSRIRNASGSEAPREFDQPHTIIVNNIFRLPRHWNISLMWTYHTGYPYTPMQVNFINQRPNHEGIVLFYKAGYKNSGRLPDVHSLDLRFEKSWYIKKNTLMVYLNIVNLYDHKNLRSYYWYPYQRNTGSIGFSREEQINIPSFVSPGISFTLY